jgi:trk system potassium uptake protein TrkH
MLAILPSTDGRAIHLMRAEVPGPQKGKLVPKLRQTAIILYAIYMFFTVLETVLLCCTGMPLFDALVNTFGTVGTGGFSVKNASIGAYNNPAAEWIIGIFMLICGTNFNIFYFLLIKQFREVKKNEELRVYLLVAAASVTAIVINTWHMFEGAAGNCIRAAFFQVTTIMSTSGFATVNYDLWPAFSKTVLVILMITGACAGSTAGGLKLSRLLILIKGVWREIKQMLRPRSVTVLRLDGDPLPDETTRSALGYLAIYCVLFVSSVLFISVDGFDFETNVTGVLACFNNIGPGFSLVGPTGNFGIFSGFSKLVLSFCMLFGRLEIMPMLILFAPSTWRRR